jgi:exodeoxyribonuclease VII large subunit
MIKKITLLELNKSIQDTLKHEFSDSIWIVAEISELKVNRNGHCYL